MKIDQHTKELIKVIFYIKKAESTKLSALLFT